MKKLLFIICALLTLADIRAQTLRGVLVNFGEKITANS